MRHQFTVLLQLHTWQALQQRLGPQQRTDTSHSSRLQARVVLKGGAGSFHLSSQLYKRLGKRTRMVPLRVVLKGGNGKSWLGDAASHCQGPFKYRISLRTRCGLRRSVGGCKRKLTFITKKGTDLVLPEYSSVKELSKDCTDP